MIAKEPRPGEQELDAARADDAPTAAADAEPAAESLALENLETRCALLQDERDRLLRLLAEADNQVRRMQREQEREAARLRGELVERLLPVVDDFDRALEQLPADDEAPHAAGVRLIAQRLEELLAAFGVEPIAALGERFDPRVHEALIQLPNTDAEKGVVVQELQRGYRLGEHVIRPSKVAVAG
ncbi:MAG: nucleotide exchange factor GrpE [Candidatus Krumholzibacteriia bacterium]|nr:nucleotide exchange factor GrpE [bacterium]MCB9512813.1 nucleotide exchange factor GrpE [Candidatus Latescibacterota bacterium]MCB9516898.1 nucleotide exchange factor GrpE [Candidatus Latescibacterota bacterium]